MGQALMIHVAIYDDLKQLSLKQSIMVNQITLKFITSAY